MLGGRLVEDEDRVDQLECREHLDALGGGIHGARRALVRGDRGIGVDADHEDIAELLRAAQGLEVADVEDVEHAVRPHDRLLARPHALAPRDELL